MKIKVKNYIRSLLTRPEWEEGVINLTRSKFDLTIDQVSTIIDEMISANSLKAVVVKNKTDSFRLLILREHFVKFEGTF